jgi:hypothetical protein
LVSGIFANTGLRRNSQAFFVFAGGNQRPLAGSCFGTAFAKTDARLWQAINEQSQS